MDKKENGEELLEIDDTGKAIQNDKKTENPKSRRAYSYFLLGFLFFISVVLFSKVYVLSSKEIKGVSNKEKKTFIQKEMKNIMLNVHETTDENNEAASKWLIDYIKRNPKATIGLEAGMPPKGLYNYVLRNKGNIPIKGLKFVSLDGLCGVEKSDMLSYYYFLKSNFLSPFGIENSQINLINEEDDCEKNAIEYNKYLLKNPVDVQIVSYDEEGIFGFNEPGTSFDSTTRVVKLDEEFKNSLAIYFDKKLDKAPTKAITQGIKNVLNAKNILVIANGEKRANALQKLVKDVPNEDTPLTALKTTKGKVIIFADKKAAEKINML